MTIKFKLEEGVECPKFETQGAVGMDLRVNKIIKAFKGDVEVETEKLDRMKEGFSQRKFIKLRPFERILFGTGVSAEIPEELELQVRVRSSAALKKGLQVLNAPGTIDPDYRGEIGVIIQNTNAFLTTVELGERLVQIVPKKREVPAIEIIEELSSTERGSGGFGSTGKK